MDDQGHDGDKGNREAAKYRRKLRDAEALQDTALARVQSIQRAEAEHLATRHLAKGAPLWVGGTALADLPDEDEDDDVDPAKVTNERSRRPHRKGLRVGQVQVRDPAAAPTRRCWSPTA